MVRWSINLSLEADERKALQETYKNEGMHEAARILKLVREDVKKLRETDEN